MAVYALGQFGASTVFNFPETPFAINLARFGSSPRVSSGRRMSNSAPLTPKTMIFGFFLELFASDSALARVENEMASSMARIMDECMRFTAMDLSLGRVSL